MGKMNLQPSAFNEDWAEQEALAKQRSSDSGIQPQSIIGWIEQGIKPSKHNSNEMHGLDVHCVVGISSVDEAITVYSSAKDIGYQELSRYACLVAGQRMADFQGITQLCELWKTYYELVKGQKQEVRLACNTPVKMFSQKGYVPLVRGSYHVWCWGEDNKRRISGIVKRTGTGIRVLNPFLADALSELPDLGELSGDLKNEYQHGVRHIKAVIALLEYYIRSFQA